MVFKRNHNSGRGVCGLGEKGVSKGSTHPSPRPHGTGAVGGREKTGEGCGKESSFEENQVPIEEAGKRLPKGEVEHI